MALIMKMLLCGVLTTGGILSWHVAFATGPPILAGDSSLCRGQTGQLILVNAGKYVSFEWNTGDTSGQIVTNAPNLYSVTTTDAQGRTDSSIFMVTTGSTTYLIELEACQGDSAVYRGEKIPAGTELVYAYIDQQGCDSLVRVRVLPIAGPEFQLAADTSCWNKPTGRIQATVLSGTPPYEFSLDGGDFAPGLTFTGLPWGSHTVRFRDADGCISSLTVFVPQQPPTVLEVGDLELDCDQPSIRVCPKVVSGIPASLHWSWPDGSSAPCFDAPAPGSYSFSVFDGCETIVHTFEVVGKGGEKLPESPFYLPNAFSPDGDGINDRWGAFQHPGLYLTQFELKVFDRWGNKVFEATQPGHRWDGSQAGEPGQENLFVWVLEARITGCAGDAVQISRKGEILLLR